MSTGGFLVTSGKALSWFLWLLWACESLAPIINYTRCFVCAAPSARGNPRRAKACERTRENTNTSPAAQSIPVQLSVWSWQLFSRRVHAQTMAACHKRREKDLIKKKTKTKQSLPREAQGERNGHLAKWDPAYLSCVIYLFVWLFIYLLCKDLQISSHNALQHP